MIIRVPLIPGHNDSEQNIKALAEFVTELGLKRIDLLPYHSLGKGKYARLGLEYELSDLKPYESKEVEVIKTFLESYGLEVGVG
jgi:pyruvate formate lyase activating enzyme